MINSLVVLTDFFAVTNRALSYAAGLAVPLDAQLVLLHVRYDGLPVPEGFQDQHSPQGELKTRQALLHLAADQTVPTEVDIAAGFLPSAVREAIVRHQPLFLVLARPDAAPDSADLLTNVVMDVLRHVPHPLLLVPTVGITPFPPRRLLLAVDGQPFIFNDLHHQQVLSQLLHASQATLDVVHVSPDQQTQPLEGALMQTLRANGLANTLTETRLHEVYHSTVADGVLEEVARQHADMLVVVARRHTLLGNLFHRSVTAQLIAQSPIPVLVLPAED